MDFKNCISKYKHRLLLSQILKTLVEIGDSTLQACHDFGDQMNTRLNFFSSV